MGWEKRESMGVERMTIIERYNKALKRTEKMVRTGRKTVRTVQEGHEPAFLH